MRQFFENLKANPLDRKIKGAEIGVALGDNAVDFLQGLPEIEKVCLVDAYLAYYGSPIQDNQDRNKQRAIQALSGFKQVEWFFMSSASAAWLVDNETLDFVYIDANHHEEGISTDIEVWWPKVINGGFIGGHDFDSQEDNFAVQRVVSNWIAKNGFRLFVEGSDWWVQK